MIRLVPPSGGVGFRKTPNEVILLRRSQSCHLDAVGRRCTVPAVVALGPDDEEGYGLMGTSALGGPSSLSRRVMGRTMSWIALDNSVSPRQP